MLSYNHKHHPVNTLDIWYGRRLNKKVSKSSHNLLKDKTCFLRGI